LIRGHSALGSNRMPLTRSIKFMTPPPPVRNVASPMPASRLFARARPKSRAVNGHQRF
jgi:hypothetical protein